MSVHHGRYSPRAYVQFCSSVVTMIDVMTDYNWQHMVPGKCLDTPTQFFILFLKKTFHVVKVLKDCCFSLLS